MNQNTFPMLIPFINDYSRTMVFKVMMRWQNAADEYRVCRGGGRTDIDDILEYFKKLDIITRGVDKIAILTGWQAGGHDFCYPAWEPVDQNIRSSAMPHLPPADALRYLMDTAREKFHTRCSLHVNLVDGYDDSALFAYYSEKNLFCKEKDGTLIKTWYDEGNHRQGYAVDMTAAWESGETKKQIDQLFLQFPQLKLTGALHTDANIVFAPNPFLGHTRGQQIETYRAIIRYIRTQYHTDVTGEYGLKVLYGYSPLGMTWAGSAGGTLDSMMLPPYIMAGGNGDAGQSGGTDLFGNSVQLEKDIFHDDLQSVIHDFATKTLPYFYLNTKLRLSCNCEEKQAELSDQIIVTCSANIPKIVQNSTELRNGNDIFMPVSWRENELMAYSETGATLTAAVPDSSMTAYDVYRVRETGLVFEETVSVRQGTITLFCHAGALKVVLSAGADPVKNTLGKPAASAAICRTDTSTKGDWRKKYGAAGYKIIGGETNLPDSLITLAGGKTRFFEINTDDPRALYTGLQTENRTAAAYSAILHETITINTPHPYLSLYFLDYFDSHSHTLVEILDTKSGERLCTYSLSSYEQGTYITLKIYGAITVRLTRLYHENMNYAGKPFLSGIFIDDA